MYYVRYPLSLRQVEDMLHERGIDICHETVRYWWHMDEVFVKIKGKTHYLWRAVDHEGNVIESYVTKRRNKRAALKFLRKAIKSHGMPKERVTD